MESPARLRIRAASVTDLACLQSIGRETYLEHFPSIWSEAYLREFLRRDFSTQALQASLTSPDHTWLIAQDARGTALGYAKLNWNRPDPVRNLTGTELQKIYFRANATGNGYGSRLLDFILDMAARRSVRLWLGVIKSNVDARRFYERRGFQTLGEIPFNTDLLDIGMWIMACPLSTDRSLEAKPLRPG